MLADLAIGSSIVRKADGGRRPEAIREIPVETSALKTRRCEMTRAFRIMTGLLGATLLLSLGLAAGCAPSLPPAAADAVKAAFPQARIVEVEQEKEDGVTVYEVELRQDGKEVEITVSPDGVIVEVETQIPEAELPKAVAQTIAKVAGGAKVEEIEREETRAVVRDGKVVKLDEPRITYEAEFRKDGRETEVEIAADGSVLKTEAEDDGED
jgi:uncharacterized membrane protein YkoI